MNFGLITCSFGLPNTVGKHTIAVINPTRKYDNERRLRVLNLPDNNSPDGVVAVNLMMTASKSMKPSLLTQKT